MTRLLYLPDDATIIQLEVSIPARQLTAAVNAGLDPLPQVFARGRRNIASLIGNTVIVFPRRKRERTVRPNYSSMLTRRQNQVLELAMSGCTNLQIAETMGISIRTVTYHLKGIKARIQPGEIPGLLKHDVR
jgi:DNA-binding CsgD family transcriptional regulator